MPSFLRALPPLLLLAALGRGQSPEAPATAAPPAPEPPPALATIRQEELLAHATWLAADERGGRLTGSPGQIAAANYIAEHFAAAGLEPLGDEAEGKRTWFQAYGISRTHVGEESKLELGALSLADGFAVLGGGAVELAAAGKLRFCGRGVTRGPAADLAEAERLDGAIAVVVTKTPRGNVDRELGMEHKMMLSFATLRWFGDTARGLAAKGAAAVLFVQLDDRFGLSDVLNYVAVAPGKDRLRANFAGADNTLALLGRGSAGKVPSLVLSVPASERLLAELGLTKPALEAFVAGDGERPDAKADVPAKLTLVVRETDDATACNVVGLLRGSDPGLAAEAVVYSAHMDHVGTRIDGEVFNGADDNASGTAGLLAIAKAFGTAKERPRRSVIFLAVSGEELGLWGSEWFADNPPWDPAKLVANVNTDMIGRSGPESGALEVTVTPSHGHRKFSTLVRDAARFGQALGVSFTSGDKYWERSDHYNFAKKGIPVVFFCNGEHPDYHQVTDHADLLDGAKMERIARLAFWTGWAAANADERPRTLGRRERWL